MWPLSAASFITCSDELSEWNIVCQTQTMQKHVTASRCMTAEETKPETKSLISHVDTGWKKHLTLSVGNSQTACEPRERKGEF